MTTAVRNRLQLGTALLMASILAGDHLLGEMHREPGADPSADHAATPARPAPIAPFRSPSAARAPALGLALVSRPAKHHGNRHATARIASPHALAPAETPVASPPDLATDLAAPAEPSPPSNADPQPAVAREAIPPLTPAVLTRWRESPFADNDEHDADAVPPAPAEPPAAAKPESAPVPPPAAPVEVDHVLPDNGAAAHAADPTVEAHPPIRIAPAAKRLGAARARAVREAKARGADGTHAELSALVASTEALKRITARVTAAPAPAGKVGAPSASPVPAAPHRSLAAAPTHPAPMVSLGSDNFRRSIAAARAALGAPARGAEAPSPAPPAATPALPIAANDPGTSAALATNTAPPPTAGSDRFRSAIAAAREALGEAPRAEAPAPPAAPAAQSQSAQRINSYGREVTLDFPADLNGAPLGDMPLRIGTDDSLAISPEALAKLLEGKVDPSVLDRIRAIPATNGMAALDRFRAAGVTLRFDVGAARLYAQTAVEGGARTDIALVRAQGVTPATAFVAPAGVSGYLNLATGLGYDALGRNAGVVMPILSASLSLRAGGVVFESDFTSDFGRGRRFTRGFSRFVFDQPEHDRRFVAGDIFAASTGLLSVPALLGVGVERQQRMFDPSRNLRPQSYQSFALSNPSQVDVVINGVTVRRLSLAPGSYKLSDFPFVSGSNNVQIVATDSFGRRDVADFDSYVDFSLLQPGQDEFNLSAGFLANQGSTGPSYNFARPIGNFAYRRGLSPSLTLGGGLQLDRQTQAASLQTTFSTPFGVVLAEASGSNNSQLGFGYAGRMIYQWGGANTHGAGFSGVGLSVDYTTSNYTSVGTTIPQRSINALRVSGTASFRLSRASYVTAGGSYATRHGGRPDTFEASLRLSQRLDRSTYFSVGGGYEHSEAYGRGAFFQVGLTRRFGGRGYGSAEYDSRTGRGRLNYTNAGSGNAGDFTANASIDAGRDGITGNGSLLYRTSNAEFGVNEGVAYDISGSRIASSRTNATVATSILFADGALAVGRPVTDSFAIVRPHATLKPATIYVDHRDQAYLSRSGTLGPAAVTQLASYSERTISVDVPDAPMGYDLGQGSFRVRPPYHAGYKLTVGSEYTLTAMGYLKENGQPVLLATGRATLVGDPAAPVVEIFTDRAGRFGAAGLKPGTYRIELGTSPPLEFQMIIPAKAQGLIRVGDLEAI